MAKKDDAVELALRLANDPKHGYDQTSRWGPDYDCSSFLCYVWQEVGVPVRDKGATYTGNMYNAFKAAGFKDVTGSINKSTGAGLRSGDVLLNVKSHTAMHIGGGKIVHASGNERGGITGGTPGDQTGSEIGTRTYYNYPWDYVLRFEEEATTTETGTYVVQSGDSLWALAERWLGNGICYKEIMDENELQSAIIHPGQTLKIPGSEPEEVTATAPAAWIEVKLPILELGAKGHSVEALQTLLYANTIPLPQYGIDGEFGEETKKGLLQFQKSQGLPETGVADKLSWKALLGGQ